MPPFVVLRIVPRSPTIVPVLTSVNETSYKLFVVPLVCCVQLVPPFVVLRIIPPSTTAVPVFASVNDTPYK